MPAGSTNATSDAAPHELGILFIHGIGEQVRGQPTTPSTPANATLQISLTPHDSVQPKRATRLLAESHWADSFPQPSFAEVMGWSMRAVPWVLASFFGRRIRLALEICGDCVTAAPLSSPV